MNTLVKSATHTSASKGLFITFEGVDGCGKTTQWQRVTEALQSQYPGREIIQTRNPGGTLVGQAIRQLLLAPTPEGQPSLSPMAELLLYMADRAQHVDEVLRPALQRGAIILCDRFVDSSIAYQGAARGLEASLIQQLNTFACGEIQPDVTLLFDADIETLALRVEVRGSKDRLELEGVPFQQRVQAGFIALAKQEPKRIHLLDATRPIEALTEACLTIISQHL
jgi:dTMP kinase